MFLKQITLIFFFYETTGASGGTRYQSDIPAA